MATLTVGRNQQYGTIAAAVAAARNGDTVSVQAGTYVDDVATIRTNIALVSSGGQVVLLGTDAVASGGALLTVAATATVDGFVFADAHAADGTAAGLLQTAGALTVENSLFTGNQNGLVSTAGPMATVSIQGSEFAGNGDGTGFSANVSVGAIQSLGIANSYVHDAAGGDEVRSLARGTTVANSRIEDNAAAAGNVLDLPDGGTVSVQGSVLEHGARSAAAAAIRFGGGAAYANSSLSVSGNTLVTDKAGALLVQNSTAAAASISANALWGFTGTAVNSGLAVMSANTVAATRPAVPTAAVIAYATGSPTQFGVAGAVVADGTVLKVGAGGAYGTLAAAVAAAHDGDTIAVAAGTYAIAPLTVTHKVIIEGVGGLASFTAGGTTAAAALLTTATDVTLRNVEISGAGAAGGHEAAVDATGGNLVIVNSDITRNGNGVIATGAATTLGIYNTELADNGTPDGLGGNVAAAAINTLVLSGDDIHDALAGPEVSSAAAYTVIDGTRISQADGDGAADLLLPAGGQVTVTGSALEKGADAQATPLVQVGGGTVAAGSTVAISSTTLVSDLVDAPTTFISGNPAATTTAAGDTFVGGASGSTQASSATVSGAMVATGVSVNTASPWTNGISATGAFTPPSVPLTVPVPTAAAERGVLILDISGTAYEGDAEFQLRIDGMAVAGILTASAAHDAGDTQTFTVAGTFAPGPHSVAVQFVNALSGAGGMAGRTLSLDGAQFNGQPVGQAVTLRADGTATLSTGTVAAVATPITVGLSETAWHGDAQALITIDGKVQAGVQTVTASHTLGGTEALRFLPSLAPGTHTLDVTFLNGVSGPAADRNLYVDSVDVAGTHYAGASPSLTGGTSSFAFNVTPAAASANANLFVTAGTPGAASLIVPGG